MSARGRIVLVVLLLAVAATAWYAAAVGREKQQISVSYQKAQNALAQLEQERSSLIQELGGAQQELKGLEGIREELQKWKSELTQTQTKLEQTQAELASLQVEYTQIRNTNASLVNQLNVVSEEKEALEAKFSNIDELKSAIRQVKREMWASRMASWREHVQTAREEDARQLETGNRGFIVRNGNPTLGAAGRVQVRVLEPQTATQ